MTVNNLDSCMRKNCWWVRVIQYLTYTVHYVDEASDKGMQSV